MLGGDDGMSLLVEKWSRCDERIDFYGCCDCGVESLVCGGEKN